MKQKNLSLVLTSDINKPFVGLLKHKPALILETIILSVTASNVITDKLAIASIFTLPTKFITFHTTDSRRLFHTTLLRQLFF